MRKFFALCTVLFISTISSLYAFTNDFESGTLESWVVVQGSVNPQLSPGQGHNSDGYILGQVGFVPAQANRQETSAAVNQTWWVSGWVNRATNSGSIQFGWDDGAGITINSGSGWQYVADTITFSSPSSTFDVFFFVSGLSGTQGFLDDVSTFQILSPDTTPPLFPDIPDVKMFISQPSLSTAFNLVDYNTGGTATTHSQGANNFLGKSSVTGSVVSEASNSSATSGSNSYIAGNPYGAATSTNKVKYSTYKIKKLPQMELYANGSTLVDVSAYAINSVGSALPPSFGTSSALIVSDLSRVTAYWDTTSTKVIIKTLAGFTSGISPINVDVIAAPTVFPFGSDIDKERIGVYPIVSTTGFDFSNGSDTTLFAYAIPAGASTLAGISYASTINDGGGAASHGGALAVTFSTPTDGVKITPGFTTWLPNQQATYYTFRARVFGTNTVNNYLQLFFNGVPAGTPTDIQGYYRFSVPTSWTTIEIPISSYTPVSTGPAMYPQLVIKANGATGSVYIDEIHIYQGTPTVIGASRYASSDNFAYGYWGNVNDINNWSVQNVSGSPGLSISLGTLNASFSGGTQTGVKLTALSNSSTIYIFNTTIGKQAGMHMKTSLTSGIADIVNTQVQLNMLGAAGATGINALTQAVDLAAAAEIGRVSNRTFHLAFNPNDNYYQVQFILKGNNSQMIQVDNTQADSDKDDPNYGDFSLFP